MKPISAARLSVALDCAARALGVATTSQRTILRTLADEAVRIARLDADEPDRRTPASSESQVRSVVDGAFDPDRTPVQWPRRSRGAP